MFSTVLIFYFFLSKLNRLWVANDVKVRKDFANDPERRRAGVGEDIVDENFDDGGAQDEVDKAAIRYVAPVALYGGFAALIFSVCLLTHLTDVVLTPPTLPAMQCVMNVTLQYFTISLVSFVSATAEQFALLP